MKIRFTLDAVASGVLALLTTLVGLIILYGNLAGIRVSADIPKNGLISPLQVIKLTFSEPVDFPFVSQVVSMDPILDGYLEWVDERTVEFVPIQPFEQGVAYKLTISPEILNTDGHALKKVHTWEFSVREPLVAYLSADAKHSSIWAMDLKGNPPQQLTKEGTQVLSFEASPSGDFIVFTVINKQGGIDLWRVSRNGGDESILLDCGSDRCTRTAISPNGKRIAYSREAAFSSDLPYGSPRIWVLDLQNGQDNPVYENEQIIGYGPSWSPDSNKLASFDGLADQINLIDLKENKQFVFPSNTGGPIAWSPDSTRILFTNVEQASFGLRTQVEIADLSLGKSEPLIGQFDDHDYAYYSLAWSSMEDVAVLGFLASEDHPNHILWRFNPSTLEGIVIADQDGYSYNSPQWDPWGNAILFQQFKLSGEFNPEVSMWKPGFNEPLVLTPGVMPHWLP